MYRLIIVDDEPTVRHGLQHYFDWQAYGIEVAGEADDGEAALALMEKVRPDLVLTDVRMPNRDGISLASVVRERYPQAKIVFVSGYDDAEYLKSALKVNAVDYIFKPVNLEEMRTVIERVAGDLKLEEKQRELIENMNQRLKQSMPLLREKFVMSLFRERVLPASALQERLEFLEMELPLKAAYWVIVIEIDDNAEAMESRSERDKHLLSYAVQNVCQELIEQHMGGYIIENRIGEYVGIVYSSEEDGQADRLFPLLEQIRDNLDRWLSFRVTVGVGEQVAGLHYLSRSYNQAREAADLKWYMGKNRILTMDSLERDKEDFPRLEALQMDRLLGVIKAGDPSPLHAVLEELFEPLVRSHRGGIQYCRNVALQVWLHADRMLLEMNVQQSGSGEKEKESWEGLLRQETLDDLKRQLESRLTAVCLNIRNKRSGKSSNVIERIHKVIEDRYAENLTVADIAKEVYLTSTYICLLFKQETGKTINEHLTKVRVERAKELLRDPRNKFYDVCYAVGYADPSYFSKLFKKYTGLTPSTYRDSAL